MSVRMAGALRASVTDPAGGEREAVLLRVADEDGVVGWGEASPLPRYSPDSLTDVERALDRWAVRWAEGEIETDEGRPVARGDTLFGTLDPAALPSAACAIDTAILDLAARRFGVPLHALLLDMTTPARPVERLAVAGLVTLAGVSRPGAPETAEPALRQVSELVAAGYRTIKCKLGGVATDHTGPEADEAVFAGELEQLRAIRREFPYLTLRLDANGRWSVASARDRLRTLKREINPEFVEQPVGPEELFALPSVPVPIAADESLRLQGAPERLTGPGGCAVFVLKPMVLGGLRRCLRLAEAAFEDGIRTVVSHTFGGPISHAAACELALALGAADPSGDAPAAGLAGHEELPQRSGAWIVPADEPGHGVDASW